MNKTSLKLLVLAAAMSVATAASAQQTAGTWLGTLGLNKITPKVDSGDAVSYTHLTLPTSDLV